MPTKNSSQIVKDLGLTKDFISLAEASEFCNYSQEYLSLRCRQGKLAANKLGRNWVIKLSDLEQYIETNAENDLGNKKGKIETEKYIQKSIATEPSFVIVNRNFKNIKETTQIVFQRILEKLVSSFFVIKKFVGNKILWQKTIASITIVTLLLSSMYITPAAAESYHEDLQKVFAYTNRQVELVTDVVDNWQWGLANFNHQYPVLSPATSVKKLAQSVDQVLTSIKENVEAKNQQA
ncbi:MAG: helix-turn-helix domain-containing protein, partial [Candidatus Komeilibacteria bacterium]